MLTLLDFVGHKLQPMTFAHTGNSIYLFVAFQLPAIVQHYCPNFSYQSVIDTLYEAQRYDIFIAMNLQRYRKENTDGNIMQQFLLQYVRQQPINTMFCKTH